MVCGGGSKSANFSFGCNSNLMGKTSISVISIPSAADEETRRWASRADSPLSIFPVACRRGATSCSTGGRSPRAGNVQRAIIQLGRAFRIHRRSLRLDRRAGVSGRAPRTAGRARGIPMSPSLPLPKSHQLRHASGMICRDGKGDTALGPARGPNSGVSGTGGRFFGPISPRPAVIGGMPSSLSHQAWTSRTSPIVPAWINSTTRRKVSLAVVPDPHLRGHAVLSGHFGCDAYFVDVVAQRLLAVDSACPFASPSRWRGCAYGRASRPLPHRCSSLPSRTACGNHCISVPRETS